MNILQSIVKSIKYMVITYHVIYVLEIIYNYYIAVFYRESIMYLVITYHVISTVEIM